LLLAPIALLAIVTAAQANEGSTSLGAAARDRSGRAIVERVAWETVDGKSRLVIAVRGVADYTARATGADSNGGLPDRAYVDLRPAVLGKEVARAPLMVDDGLARQIRVGQFDPQTVRVVVDLAAPGIFEVRTSEKPTRLLLGIVPRPARADGAAVAAALPPAQGRTAAEPPADARGPAGPREVVPSPDRAAVAPVPTALPVQMARAAEPTEIPSRAPTAAPRTPGPVAPATDAPGTPAATGAPAASPSPVPAATAAPQTVAAPAATPGAEAELSIAALPRAAGRQQGAASPVAEHEAAVQFGAVDPPPAAPQAPAVPPRATSGRNAGKTARVPAPRLWTVVIDPGHGGKDPGAKGVTGADEKDITLAIARLLAERLSEDPQIRAVLTRTDDSYVSLEQRTAIANAQGADLFLSIHGNASESPQLAGVETYTLNNTDDRATIRLAALENGLALTGASPGERDLAYILSDLVQTGKEDESVTLARAVQGNLVSYLRDRWRGVVNLGVKKGPFYVLVGAYMPCILVEVAFLSNETEGQRIAARRYQKDVADGIALGVRRFLASDSANANL